MIADLDCIYLFFIIIINGLLCVLLLTKQYSGFCYFSLKNKKLVELDSLQFWVVWRYE